MGFKKEFSLKDGVAGEGGGARARVSKFFLLRIQIQFLKRKKNFFFGGGGDGGGRGGGLE